MLQTIGEQIGQPLNHFDRQFGKVVKKNFFCLHLQK